MSTLATGLPVLLVPGVAVACAAAARGVWSPCGLSMISAINPFTERSRGHRFGLTALWFVLGAIAGGALLGAAGALGALLVSALAPATTLVAAIAAGCTLVTFAADLKVFGVRLPLIPRQVNERWIGGYRRWVYASGFGAQIGAGLLTYVMSAGVYLTPTLGALSGSPLFALALGVLFGFVRGSAVLISSTARGPELLLLLHRRLAALEPWSMRLVLLVQAAVAVLLGWFAAGGWGAGATAALLLLGVVRRVAARPPRRSAEVPRPAASAVTG